MSNSGEKGFNAKILECIERALDSLGEGVKQSFYFQVKEKFSLQNTNFVTNPELLIELLAEILGPAGSSFISQLLVREIKKSFDLRDDRTLPLSTVIQDARRKFLDAS